MSTSFKTSLSKLADYLESLKNITDICIVNFITENSFETLRSLSLEEDLLLLTNEEIQRLPYIFSSFDSTLMLSFPQNLLSFLIRMKAHDLESLGVLSSRESLFSSSSPPSSSSFSFSNTFMPLKKTHEVLRMSEIVNILALKHDIDSLVDVGSGKGYLSFVLSSIYGFRVLALEASSGNIRGAKDRERNLKKHVKSDFQKATATNLCRKSDSESRNLYRTESVFVSRSTSLTSLFQKAFKLSSFNEYGLIGLHTCGTLSSTSFHHFLLDESCKLLFNVGCCYHLLSEEFTTESTTKNENEKNKNNEEDGEDDHCFSFPLSSLLRDRKFSLGENARILSSQPCSRTAASHTLPSKSLLWRAILQDLFRSHIPELLNKKYKIGRIASKSKDYLNYVHKAFQKLNLNLKLSDKIILDHYHEMKEKHERKLVAFIQFRSLLAPLIEGLILLDRLVYLQEHFHVTEAHLTTVFDPVISPRCFGLFARKSL